MVTTVYPTVHHGKYVHLNANGQIELPLLEQGVHLLNLGFLTPSINNGSDEAAVSNGGLRKGCLGNKLVENKSSYIKPFIF